MSGALRVGIVCPYSFDAPGGVQFHVRDLAAALTSAGHHAEVLAPADDDTVLPPHVVGAGKAIPIKYNGSVARLAFGPVVAARVRKWLADGDFDIVHIHEPAVPSLSVLALWSCEVPIVGTFHSSQTRSRMLQIASPFVRPALEKLRARIAVSEDARRTLVDHLGGDAVVIPNGVYVDDFASAERDERFAGTPDAPTVAFLGRLDEPRKGLAVLTAAVPALVARFPGIRILVAGRGDEGAAAARETLGELARHLTFLGGISDDDKARLLKSVDVYLAPQTGGESFGIVLVEAMSAGTCVVASDLPAFERVLADGQAGRLFTTGDPEALAAAVIDVLEDDTGRTALIARASTEVLAYDWSTVTAQVLTVYQTVLEGQAALSAVAEPTGSRRRSRSDHGGQEGRPVS